MGPARERPGRPDQPADDQDIDREAYDGAWDDYGRDGARAHRVAWDAVERRCREGVDGNRINGASEG